VRNRLIFGSEAYLRFTCELEFLELSRYCREAEDDDIIEVKVADRCMIGYFVQT